MPSITLRDITRENWRASLSLTVYPEQQRFVADHTPIAAIALAKAYILSSCHFVIPQQPIQRRAQLVGRFINSIRQHCVAAVTQPRHPVGDLAELWSQLVMSQ